MAIRWRFLETIEVWVSFFIVAYEYVVVAFVGFDGEV